MIKAVAIDIDGTLTEGRRRLDFDAADKPWASSSG